MNATSGQLCQRCGRANAPGAMFCAHCGAAVAASGNMEAPPPAPPMPARAAFQAAARGSQRPVNLALAPQQAFTAAQHALSAAGAEIVSQQPNQALQFQLAKGSIWLTAGTKVRYFGELRLAPSGATQSQASLSVKIDWSSATGVIVLCGVCLLLSWTLLPLLLAAYTIYTVAIVWPRQAIEAIQQHLQALAGGDTMARSTAVTSFPTPVVNAPAPATLHDQLRKLKELHDTGILTSAEFESKKSDILARM